MSQIDMERKLIRLADKTLVVSLPYKWAEKWKLKKGDSVEVLDKNSELLISPLSNKKKMIAKLDFRRFNERLIKRFFSAAYKVGFDELVIVHNKEDSKLIEGLVNRYIGLIWTEKEKDKIIIKNVFDSKNVNFESVFRKTFLLTCSLASESLKILKEKDTGKASALLEGKENFIKHINLSLHLLNSEGARSIKETNTYFYIISLLDLIIDFYFRLCKNFAEYGVIKKKTLNFYLKVNNLLETVYKVYFLGEDVRTVYSIREDIFKDKSSQDFYNTLLSVIVKLILELIECRIMLDISKS